MFDFNGIVKLMVVVWSVSVVGQVDCEVLVCNFIVFSVSLLCFFVSGDISWLFLEVIYVEGLVGCVGLDVFVIGGVQFDFGVMLCGVNLVELEMKKLVIFIIVDSIGDYLILVVLIMSGGKFLIKDLMFLVCLNDFEISIMQRLILVVGDIFVFDQGFFVDFCSGIGFLVVFVGFLV